MCVYTYAYAYVYVYVHYALISILQAYPFEHGRNGHIQDGRLKNAENQKTGISVAQILIITEKQNLPLNICFWRWQIQKDYRKAHLSWQ